MNCFVDTLLEPVHDLSIDLESFVHAFQSFLRKQESSDFRHLEKQKALDSCFRRNDERGQE